MTTPVWPDDAFVDAPPEPEFDDVPAEYMSAFLDVCPAGGTHTWTFENGEEFCIECHQPRLEEKP